MKTRVQREFSVRADRGDHHLMRGDRMVETVRKK